MRTLTAINRLRGLKTWAPTRQDKEALDMAIAALTKEVELEERAMDRNMRNLLLNKEST